MVKAVWNDVVLAESSETILIEGTHYFPPHSVKFEYLRPSDLRTSCSWRGMARYYNVVDHDKVSEDAAWYYPKPKEEAWEIKGYVAFWNDVRIES